MIYRWTVWLDEDQDELQVTLAALDDSWDPLCVFTRQCGPFHPLAEQQMALRADVRRWLAECGHQQALDV